MNKAGFSSAEVARQAGVSRTTVSFVLNNTPGKVIPEETRQRILEVARSLDYRPDMAARRVAKATRRNIGLAIGHSGSIYSDAYVLRLLEGIAPVFNKRRCRLVLVPLGEEQAVDRGLAARHGLDGILVTNLRQGTGTAASMEDPGVPMVAIGVVGDPGVCQIDIDNRQAAQAAVDHLLGLGHRRVAMIVHAPLVYDAAQARLAGYEGALRAARLGPDDRLVRVADFSEESGRLAMRDLLTGQTRPSAVFAGNDAIAWGAMRAIGEAGLRIPEDISLVGFDDDFPSRFLQPALTTVTVPATSLGERAARMLIDLVEGREPAQRHVLVPVALTVRESTAPWR